MKRDAIEFNPYSRHPLPPTGGIGAGPVPTEKEARAALALDLAHGDLALAAALVRLPLFDVAMDGSEAP